jgi:DNA polymerase III delta subunit
MKLYETQNEDGSITHKTIHGFVVPAETKKLWDARNVVLNKHLEEATKLYDYIQTLIQQNENK